MFEPGMTGEELYSSWSSFGESPIILRADHTQPQAGISSTGHARERAAAIAASIQHSSEAVERPLQP